MTRRPSERAIRLLLFLAAFAAAIAVATATGHFLTPERWEYSYVAEQLLQGRGLVYEYMGTKYYFYGSAVYPLALAGVLWAGGGQAWMMVAVHAVWFGCTALVLYALARPLFGASAAVLAGMLAALHPGGLVYVGKLHSQTLDVLLTALCVLLLVRLRPQTRLARAVGTGLVTGLAMLSRATLAPFLALWGLWLVWKSPAARAAAVRVVAGVAVGAALMLAPMVIRGWRMYGRLIPLRTDTGLNLWYGNHPGASGTSHALGSTTPVLEGMPKPLLSQMENQTRNEVEVNALLTAAAWDAIRQDPAAAWQRFVKKFGYFWWFSPHTGLHYPASWAVGYRVYYALLLGLAVIGIVQAWRSGDSSRRDATVLVLLLAASVSVIQAAFYVEGRHRWLIEPLLLVWSAAGACRVAARTA